MVYPQNDSALALHRDASSGTVQNNNDLFAIHIVGVKIYRQPFTQGITAIWQKRRVHSEEERFVLTGPNSFTDALPIGGFPYKRPLPRDRDSALTLSPNLEALLLV